MRYFLTITARTTLLDPRASYCYGTYASRVSAHASSGHLFSDDMIRMHSERSCYDYNKDYTVKTKLKRLVERDSVCETIEAVLGLRSSVAQHGTTQRSKYRGVWKL